MMNVKMSGTEEPRQSNKKKKTYNGRLSTPNLKTYKVVTIRTLWCEYQDRQVDQWSRIERLGMNS